MLGMPYNLEKSAQLHNKETATHPLIYFCVLKLQFTALILSLSVPEVPPRLVWLGLPQGS